MNKEAFYFVEIIGFFIMLLLMLFLAGCATPRYEDGTRAGMMHDRK